MIWNFIKEVWLTFCIMLFMFLSKVDTLVKKPFSSFFWYKEAGILPIYNEEKDSCIPEYLDLYFVRFGEIYIYPEILMDDENFRKFCANMNLSNKNKVKRLFLRESDYKPVFKTLPRWARKMVVKDIDNMLKKILNDLIHKYYDNEDLTKN